jgi:hypothetical protein
VPLLVGFGFRATTRVPVNLLPEGLDHVRDETIEVLSRIAESTINSPLALLPMGSAPRSEETGAARLSQPKQSTP